MRRIYLDHNATGPPTAAALEAFQRAARTGWGNPASTHGEGREAGAMLEAARRQVAELASAPPAAVFFTSGGTESAHAALQGVARAAGTGRIVVSGIEHASVRAAAAALEPLGYEVTAVPPERNGRVDAGRFLDACAAGTVAAALMVAHNEFGTLQPVDSVAKELQERGVPLVTDAVQAPGRLSSSMPKGDHVVGFFSAHKIGGLAGAGAVVAAADRRLFPVLGGGEQERGRRSGTPPVSLAAAMGAAAAELMDAGQSARERMARLRARFESGLLAGAEDVTVIGADVPRLPNTSGFLVQGIRGEDLVAALDLAGVAVSFGSACSTGSSRPSASLLALGLAPESARGFVRISLGPATAEEEIDTALGLTLEAVARLRRHVVARRSW
jgi:cysteine desulfurase